MTGAITVGESRGESRAHREGHCNQQPDAVTIRPASQAKPAREDDMKIIGGLLLAAGLILSPAAGAQAPVKAPAAQAKAAPKAPHIVIFHAEGRRSERIVWLCEELGLPYELHYRRGDVAGSFEDIYKVNPGMRVAPTVFYDGQLMMESGGIIETILGRAVLIELFGMSVLPDDGIGNMRQDGIIEEVGQRVLILIQSAADEQRRG
jgi:hypothetical protein